MRCVIQDLVLTIAQVKVENDVLLASDELSKWLYDICVCIT